MCVRVGLFVSTISGDPNPYSARESLQAQLSPLLEQLLATLDDVSESVSPTHRAKHLDQTWLEFLSAPMTEAELQAWQALLAETVV